MFSFLLAWFGCAVIFWRLRPLNRVILRSRCDDIPLISLIVPARNEEKNLSFLLMSLQQLTYPRVEIIVVDDRSEDKTAHIARSFGVDVIEGKPLPEGWNGKNWACHQGAMRASGQYFLFTDADTQHRADSLEEALHFFKEKKADLISALPYHRNERFWEKLLGPFHALVYVATAPATPRFRRLFAIGQYLLFSRESYFRLGGLAHPEPSFGGGGHQAVASQYPDDLSLANLCLTSGGTYAVHTGSTLFEVKMYDSLKEMVRGWRRNFLAGIQRSRWQATMEVALAICAIAGGGAFLSNAWAIAPMLLAALVIAVHQKSWGNFSTFGVLFWPFSLALYCWVTALALVDFMSGNVLEWRGRRYRGWLIKEKNTLHLR